MRKKFVAGNWKMFTDHATAKKLAQEVVALMAGNDKVDVALCPPFTYLQTVGEVVKGTQISLGAQICYH